MRHAHHALLLFALAVLGAVLSHAYRTRDIAPVPSIGTSLVEREEPTPEPVMAADEGKRARRAAGIRIVDRLTGSPLPDVRVEAIEGTGSRHPIARTNRDGFVSIPDLDAYPTLRFTAGSTGQPAVETATVLEVGTVEIQDGDVLQLPVEGRLRLIADGPVDIMGHVTVFTVADDPETDATTLRCPEAETTILAASFETVEGDASWVSRHSGEVRVAIWGRFVADEDNDGALAELIPTTLSTELRPGEETVLYFSPILKPSVWGTLVDEAGRPVPHAEVTVAVRSTFSVDDDFPWVENEPGNPAFSLVRAAASEDAIGIAQLTRRTNAEGEFCIAMPYSDEVALWSFASDGRRAYLELPPRGHDADAGEITLILEQTQRSRMTMQSGVRGASRARVARANPPHPFQLSMPISVDAEGTLDVSGLELGVEYAFLLETDTYRHVVRAVVAPGASLPPSR